MKQFIVAVILLMVTKCGWSQPGVYFTITGADSSFFKNRHLPFGNSFTKPDTIFSHFTNTGTVYTLPQDNMPWLKPNHDLVDNMPVKSDAGNSNMPNGYRAMPGKLIQLLNRKP